MRSLSHALLALWTARAFLAPSRRVSLPRARASDDDTADLLAAAERLRAEARELEGAVASASAVATVAPVAAPRLEAAAVKDVATSREAWVSTLADLKKSGVATRWSSTQLAFEGAEKPTEARVRAATGIDGARDLLAREEVGNDELFQLTAIVFVVSAILAVGSGALIGGNVGATFTYLFAVLPIVFLGIGSSSPGIIVGLYGLVRSAAETEADAERRRRHEAAHLVTGYRLGLAVAEYDTGDRPRVEFYAPSQGPLTRDDAEVLAAVALSGAVGECDAFGDARGAQNDFAELQSVFDRVTPPLSPAEQQAATRRAVMNSFSILYGSRARRDDAVVKAVDAAFARGAPLPEVVCALENA